jgi:hypothetical protein
MPGRARTLKLRSRLTMFKRPGDVEEEGRPIWMRGKTLQAVQEYERCFYVAAKGLCEAQVCCTLNPGGSGQSQRCRRPGCLPVA